MMDADTSSFNAPQAIAPRPLSRLTYKIMAINLITIAVLAMSFSYIAQTRENLIANEIDNLESDARIYKLLIDTTLKNFAEFPSNATTDVLKDINQFGGQQVRLYNHKGEQVFSHGDIPERQTYIEIHDKSLSLVERGLANIENGLSVNFKLPPFPHETNAFQADLQKIEQTVGGVSIAAWSAADGGLVLTADLNLEMQGKRVGTLQLIRRDLKIEDSFLDTRMAVFRFVLIAFTITISFSLYLAGLIGHPLRKLATAAEAMRHGQGRIIVEIPDMSERNDEIGELSQAMRAMTDALRKRLTSIEQFAADVAHELKNPITSMKSAVEVLPKVRNDGDRDRLLGIIQHDLQRMDRLISDISQASRLDAELSRDVLKPLDIRHILNPLIDAKSDMAARRSGERQGQIRRVGFDVPALVLGHGGRLAQVFDNLISNALSFSPHGGTVTVQLESSAERTKISVEDDGPGIPENRLDKIFDRFYSERPVNEGFGMHSGLGLSIAKQIVESHNGTLQAENRKDAQGRIIGARFIVRFHGSLQGSLSGAWNGA